MPSLIDDAEQQRRRELLSFAEGNLRLEGLVIDEAVRALDAQFVEGVLSPEQHVAALLALARG